MKHERYIIDEREIELLERYEGTINDLKYPTDWKKYLESEVAE